MSDREAELTALRAGFEAHFGALRAGVIARAPGRVNLIGEHVDYNDLAVLPLALQLRTAIAAQPRRDRTVRCASSNSRFEPREFELAAQIAPSPQGDWCNYIKAAAQALEREFGLTRGADLFVRGDIPSAAGLSSSSALVVAAGLALAELNSIAVEPLDFAERMARAERYVGVASGGMDQAICLLGREGHALRIEFAPLRAEALPCPADWRFVVAHSLVEADKAGAAREAYNRRRAECDAALEALLASPELAGSPRSYRGLLETHGAEKLAWVAERVTHGAPLARARHQFSEYVRVLRARRSLLCADAEGFGEAMDESHASLRDDYEVSCPELDALVGLARRSGALGARLTGAGFGGCIVALARDTSLERLLAALAEHYAARAPHGELDPVLVARPSRGAWVEPLVAG
mgnify:CR=1 FL=1